MIDIFGTLGPACDDTGILTKMFAAGMTGIRINLSHVFLAECRDSIKRIQEAAMVHRITPEILIDMQGPELRIGKFNHMYDLRSGDSVTLGKNGIPLDPVIISQLGAGDEVLLDDGKILAEVSVASAESANIHILRGGRLTQRKSIAIKGKSPHLPPVSQDDLENFRIAKELGITGIMQPFVRSRADIQQLRTALKDCGCDNLKIYAKIENKEGMDNLGSFIDLVDEIIIARGDLGNSMPLWELPHAQKHIAKICRENSKAFMVVTQMLASMEKAEVPTRAEVSDIYNAVLDGAASLMVTGETAVGVNPAEVIKYLSNTATEALGHPGDCRI